MHKTAHKTIYKMMLKEKFDLIKLLQEIDDDEQEQAKDLTQEKDIPQDTITELMLAHLRKKKSNTPETTR